jgi:protein-S-isoprenylcysteine O-methyltransferase Ste14
MSSGSVSNDVPNILVLPPVLVGGTLLVGILIHYQLWTVELLPTVVARVLGVALFTLSGVLAHFAQLAMKRAGTNVLPTQPTLAIATDGPYRFTRNPLYIAAIGVYVGVTLWINGLAPLLLLMPMLPLLHWGIVLREEQYLKARFGDEYLSYQLKVRRWV